MKNIFFPTTIIDGFFENPDEIRNFALSLEYSDDSETYPGKRSQQLSQVNKLFFETVIFKLLSVFFKQENLNVGAQMSFQLVNKGFGSGWVHRDPSVATAIIYLNPENNIGTGTSLYEKKNVLVDPQKEFLNVKQNSFKQHKNEVGARNELNDHYKEVLSVEGLYNRALLFDSHLYHAAHNFIGEKENESRLTLIVFFENISFIGQTFPIQKMHQQAITIL